MALFDVHLAQIFDGVLYEYDVTADGNRFLLDPSVAATSTATTPLTMVVNWNAGLKK